MKSSCLSEHPNAQEEKADPIQRDKRSKGDGARANRYAAHGKDSSGPEEEKEDGGEAQKATLARILNDLN